MTPVLEVDRVVKEYANGLRANDGMTLHVGQGEVFGLLGPNGAGKTTLVGQVMGLVKPTSGAIRIDGVDVVEQPSAARAACSYQPQSGVPIRGLTPVQAVELVGRIRGLSKADARSRTVQLLEALQLGAWAGRTVTELSGGVTRLVGFCMAAVAPGRIVILDEPTNDVDPLRRKLLWSAVRALADGGSGVLLVTHNVLEAERCVDRLAIVDRGRVVGDGTPAKLKRDLGGSLRLVVVLDATTAPPAVPGFLAGASTVGHRVVGDVVPNDLAAAVAWARALQDRGVVEEFSIGPATLEDVYIGRVAVDAPPVEERRAGSAR